MTWIWPLSWWQKISVLEKANVVLSDRVRELETQARADNIRSLSAMTMDVSLSTGLYQQLYDAHHKYHAAYGEWDRERAQYQMQIAELQVKLAECARNE